MNAHISIEGTKSEKWVFLNKEGEQLFIARFKYAQPGRKAQKIARFVERSFDDLNELTQEDLDIARDCFNENEARARRAA